MEREGGRRRAAGGGGGAGVEEKWPTKCEKMYRTLIGVNKK